MPTPTPGRQPLVLIVDDDETILRALRVALARYFRVETCNSPKRGVTMAQSLQPDVVVLDIKMPEHDGFWVFREIRKFDETVAIIFNSAYQDTLSHDDVMVSLKPFGYLPKSGNLGDFINMVNAACRQKRASQK